MNKRILAIVLTLALLMGAVGITGIVNAGAAGEGATYVPLTEQTMPAKKNLLADAKLTDGDGFPVSFSSGTRDRITDGKWQGIDEIPTFRHVNYTSTKEGKTSEPYPGISGHYYLYNNWAYSQSDVENTRSIISVEGAADGTLYPLVFDLGTSKELTAVALGSSAEPVAWRIGNAPTTVEALAAQEATYDETVMFYKAAVYAGDDADTLLDGENLLFEYDFTSHKADGFRNLWSLGETVKARYVAICLPTYISRIRISELAAYGTEKVASRTALTADNLPKGINLLHGVKPTNPAGTAELAIDSGKINFLADGGWQGLNRAVEIRTSDEQKNYSGHPAEEVPGQPGKYFMYNGSLWSRDTSDFSRTVFYTGGSNGELKPVTFDLGVTAEIASVAVGSTVERGCWQIGKAPQTVEKLEENANYLSPEVMLYKGEVYISDSLDTLYDEENRVAAYDLTDNKKSALGNLFTLGAPVSGRYVGFMLPAYSNRVRIGELGVYAAGAAVQELPYGTFSDNAGMGDFIRTGENLLLGTQVENNKKPYLLPIGLFYDAGKFEYLTDGYVNFDGEQEKAVDITLDGDSAFYYDLCGEAELDGLLIANAYGKHVSAVNIYAGDDADTLFRGANEVGIAHLDGNAAGAYVDLRKATGRYVGFMLTGDENGKVSLAELGLYGTYTAAPSRMDDSLVLGLTPLYGCDVYARGIDNRTAVDADGNPGTGNTGELRIVKDYIDGADITLLTDGDVNTRSSRSVSYPPDMSYEDRGVTSYDRPWAVLVYYLGGEATVNDVTLYSSAEYDYHVSGVQYYASYLFADLFKNESLLYTSGGEYYVEKDGKYIPDPDTEMNREQAISYRLTEEQRAKTVRYVALVVTRPYSYYSRSYPNNLNLGYGSARTSEFTVNGTYLKDDDLPTTYTAEFEGETVTVRLKPASYDDWDMFNNIAGVKVTREPIPAGVNRTTDKNWLVADEDTMLHVRLVDKSGNPIPDTGKGGMNGSEITVSFSADKDYTQTMGIIEDGKLRRLYNAFSDPMTGLLTAGVLKYPNYKPIPGNPYTGSNNRDKAVIKSADVYLVKMRYNDPDTIDELNGRRVNPSVSEFEAQE